MSLVFKTNSHWGILKCFFLKKPNKQTSTTNNNKSPVGKKKKTNNNNNKKPVTSHSMLLTSHPHFGKWHAISNLFFSSFYISSVCHFSALKHAAANQVAEALEFILLLCVPQKENLALSNSKFAILENIYSTYVQNFSKRNKTCQILADFFVSKQYGMLMYPGFKYRINYAYRDI